MCASIMPRTSPHGLGIVDGAPSTLTSDSGKIAQPSARVKSNVAPAAGSTSTSLPPETPSALPAAGSETLNAPVVPSTFQSAFGPGSDALATSEPEPDRKSPLVP